MRLVVAVVGKARHPALGEAIRDYETRAARYWPLDVHEVREEKATGISLDRVKEKEGVRLSEKVPERAQTVACESGGKAFNSAQFAEFLRKARDEDQDPLPCRACGQNGGDGTPRHRGAPGFQQFHHRPLGAHRLPGWLDDRPAPRLGTVQGPEAGRFGGQHEVGATGGGPRLGDLPGVVVGRTLLLEGPVRLGVDDDDAEREGRGQGGAAPSEHHAALPPGDVPERPGALGRLLGAVHDRRLGGEGLPEPIVVVDMSRGSGVRDVCAERGDAVRYVAAPDSQGVSDSRNRAVAGASSDQS